MEDKFLNTEELERMLGPQCEFHASEGLKDKVMNEARAVSRPRRLRLIPWLAAACVAGILVIFLTPPKDNNKATPAARVAKIRQTEQPRSVTSIETGILGKEKYIAAVPAERKRTDTRRTSPKCRQTATTGKEIATKYGETTDNSNTNADTATAAGSPNDAQWATLISETNLPITCPENAKYTPEEIEQLKRQARQAYLNWIRLEIEIASHNLQQTANVK